MEQVLFSLLQLSDTHLQAAGKRLKTGDSGAEALGQAIAKAYRTQAQFDAIILTGDLVDRGAVEEYRELEAGLRALPLGLPRYFCLGNHDAREAFYRGLRVAQRRRAFRCLRHALPVLCTLVHIQRPGCETRRA